MNELFSTVNHEQFSHNCTVLILLQILRYFPSECVPHPSVGPLHESNIRDEGTRGMRELFVIGDRVYCPQCNNTAQFLSVSKAARAADVSRRTIYNYVEDGSVYALRVAGKTLRVCANCLLISETRILERFQELNNNPARHSGRRQRI